MAYSPRAAKNHDIGFGAVDSVGCLAVLANPLVEIGFAEYKAQHLVDQNEEHTKGCQPE